MKKEFYRFRRIDSLLGARKELENQTIYFAPPKDLNDPMEGFRNLFWDGDFIVWKNLFYHYLLCLERIFSLWLISGEDHPIITENIPVFLGKEDCLSKKHQEMLNEITEIFFSNEHLSKLVKNISERSTPIRRDELSFYLSTIHPFAIETIIENYKKCGMLPAETQTFKDAQQIISNLTGSDFFKDLEDGIKRNEQLSTIIFTIKNSLKTQLNLISVYNIKTEVQKNKEFVLISFPDEYIYRIEDLLFPDWYTACFMSECKNSSVWGHYGDNHSGVCLIFESEEIDNASSLKLKCKNGLSSHGDIYNFIPFNFYSIEYKNGFGEIDFFRMLGRLPIPKLNSTWYTIDGKSSKCAEHITNSVESWRTNYWKDFYRDITIKSKDWAYENEYRLILSGSLIDYSSPVDRTLNYDFSSLKGIIFGIKTRTEDKIEIIRIVEQKCREHNRSNFKFYQAYYSSTEGVISHTELSLLRFNNPPES